MRIIRLFLYLPRGSWQMLDIQNMKNSIVLVSHVMVHVETQNTLVDKPQLASKPTERKIIISLNTQEDERSDVPHLLSLVYLKYLSMNL